MQGSGIVQGLEFFCLRFWGFEIAEGLGFVKTSFIVQALGFVQGLKSLFRVEGLLWI